MAIRHLRPSFTLSGSPLPVSTSNQGDLEYTADLLNAAGATSESSKGFWDAEEVFRLCYSTMLKPSDTFGVAIDEVPNYIVHLGSEPGERIGLINLCRRVPDVAPDLGFAITEEYRGKGYGGEAAARVLKYWTEEFGLKEVSLVTGYDNIVAQKTARRAGFVEGGFALYLPGKAKVMGFVLPGMKPLDGQDFKFWGDGQVPSATP